MITLSLSEKLLQLLAGAQIPASQLKHELITELISEGIIAERIAGRTKRTLYMQDVAAFSNWLFNKHSIPDLSDYITVLKDEASTRADLVQAGNDSKIRSRRTFRGFLANSYLPIDGQLNGKPYTKTYIDHAELMKGGTLEFVMGAAPNKNWGVAKADWPASVN